MARQPKLSTDESIQHMEFNLAKIKFVKSIFPDVKISTCIRAGKEYISFNSKSVNLLYNKYRFLGDNKYFIRIQVFYEINFTYNDKMEVVIVESSPRTYDIARLKSRWNLWNSSTQRYEKPVIYFSRLSSSNLKFRDDILNDCQIKIMEFIRANPSVTVNAKHLDSRLKKLLIFT